jgi:hypothetical protein
MTLRQFGNSTYIVPNYNELRVHLWKALIGCQNWGSPGWGSWNWGWVGSSGMEVSIYSRNNPRSWVDSKQAVWEIKYLAPALLTSVDLALPPIPLLPDRDARTVCSIAPKDKSNG